MSTEKTCQPLSLNARPTLPVPQKSSKRMGIRFCERGASLLQTTAPGAVVLSLLLTTRSQNKIYSVEDLDACCAEVDDLVVDECAVHHDRCSQTPEVNCQHGPAPSVDPRLRGLSGGFLEGPS